VYSTVIQTFIENILVCLVLVCPSVGLPALRGKAATGGLVERIVKHDSWLVQPDILGPPLLRLAVAGLVAS